MASLFARAARASWRKVAGWFWLAGTGTEAGNSGGGSVIPQAQVAALRTALVAGLLIGLVSCAVMMTITPTSPMNGLGIKDAPLDTGAPLAEGSPDWMSDIAAGFAAGIALSGALHAIPEAGDAQESELLPLRLRLVAAYSKAALEARGFESDIRMTLLAAVVVLFLRAWCAGLFSLCSAISASFGLITAAGYGGAGTTFLLGLCIPLSVALGLLHMFLLGSWLGSLAAGRFWIRFLQDKLLYHPRGYSGSVAWGEKVDFGGFQCSLQKVSYSITSVFSPEIQQTAMLLKPEGRSIGALWVVCGGNSMLATDWIPHIDRMLRIAPPHQGAAFLLLDYPGYGWNGGRTSPAAVLAASRAGVHKAMSLLGGPQPQVNLLGHSLGSAAVAQLATELSRAGIPPGRLVLSAPFLDIPTMAMCILGGLVPPSLRPLFPPLLRLLVPHRWDNAVQVPRAAKAGWQLTIIHGALDELVPCYMGRQLYTLATNAVFVGETVEVHSLINAALNGLRGKVVGVQGERLQVNFGGGQESKALRQQNVQLVSAVPQAAAGQDKPTTVVDANTRTDFVEVPAASHNDVLAVAKEVFAELIRCGSGTESASDAI